MSGTNKKSLRHVLSFTILSILGVGNLDALTPGRIEDISTHSICGIPFDYADEVIKSTRQNLK
jgi:hypothetical protein